MKVNEAIKSAMVAEGITQRDLADRCGYKSVGAIGNALGRENGMRTDVMIKMLTEMGYEIIVRKADMEIKITE